MADHAKGAILTPAITDALEVGGRCLFDTNKWTDIYHGLGDSWCRCRRMAHPWTGAGSGTSHQGPGICHPWLPRTPANHRPFRGTLVPALRGQGILRHGRMLALLLLMTIFSSLDIGFIFWDFG